MASISTRAPIGDTARSEPSSARRAGWSYLLLALVALASACAPSPDGDPGATPLALHHAEPSEVLVGSRIRVSGTGLLPPELGALEASLVGTAAGVPVAAIFEVTRLDAHTVEIALDERIAAWHGGGDVTFDGALIVRQRAGPHLEEARLPLTLLVRAALTPDLDHLGDGGALYPGDRVPVAGDGLLHPGEGATYVRFDGVMASEHASRSALVAGHMALVSPSTLGSRREGTFALMPEVLGLTPGRFSGQVRLVNVHPDGLVLEGAPRGVESLDLARPGITEVTPTRGSRGQRFYVRGRGFLAPDGLLDASTILVLDGVFTPRRGPPVDHRGPNAKLLYPEGQDRNVELGVVFRVTVHDDRTLSGLGARAGRFEGHLIPLVAAGSDQVLGAPFPVSFEILNPHQVVQLRYLPGFYEALERFGLLAEEHAVRARVLEVVTRDYAGLNISFTEDDPEDFAEFSIVEIVGADPNGAGLFGLDNTAGKDVGNLRFDDVIGGFNPDTRARNYAAYGGIFVTELLQFSPSLSDIHLASPRFDDIFAAVVPELGGLPALHGESDGGTPRGEAIAFAGRVLGNLVGHTITHEVGHTLGLAALPDRVHNVGDNPGWIMDAGPFRPFAERAEIDGEGPSFFSPFNRAYLEDVLPLDPP